MSPKLKLLSVVLGLSALIAGVSFLERKNGTGGVEQSPEARSEQRQPVAMLRPEPVAPALVLKRDPRAPTSVTAPELRLVFRAPDGRVPVPVVPFELRPWDEHTMADLASALTSAPEPAATGASDARGKARLELAPGAYELIVGGPYHALGTTRFEHPLGHEFEVRVEHGAVLEGYVQALNGSPIEGARVGVALTSYLDQVAGPEPFTRSNYRLAYTDMRGFYRLNGLLKGTRVSVSAGAPGHAVGRTAEVPITADYQEAPVLQLSPESVLFVSVLDAQGLLAPGDQVRIEVDQEFLFHVERRVRLEEDGQCDVRGLPSGSYRVTLHSRRATAPPATIQLASGEVRAVQLVARGRRPLQGRVHDHHGAPVHEATVTLRVGEDVYKAETDANGSFSIGDLRDGPVGLTVRAFGSAPYERTFAAPPVDQVLDIVLDRGLALDLRLEVDGALPRVLRLDGSTASSADEVPNSWTHIATIEQDPASGAPRVILTGLAPGRVFLVATDPEGDLIGVVDATLTGEQDTEEATLQLLPAVTLQGLVLDGEGEPLEGARLVVEYGPWPSGTMLVNDALGVSSSSTRADGGFEIQGLHPCAARLLVYHPEHGSRTVSLAETGIGYLTVRLDRNPSLVRTPDLRKDMVLERDP
ncbi:MAG TPA: carboxypeptidase regulatory-like domain-containing protein [Planctomycetes bacterium]|nr:carboxypeptidase regulatory-like domain-containing protein [Planctomycetota bacterium]